VFLRKEICLAEAADGGGPARTAEGPPTHRNEHQHTHTVTQTARIPEEPLTVLALAAGAQTMRAVEMLLSNRSSDPVASQFLEAWPRVSQMLVTVDVCPPGGARRDAGDMGGGVEDGGGSSMVHARLLADVQALVEAQELQAFVSSRQIRLPRSPPLDPALHAAGFPDLICRYRLSLARTSTFVSDDGSTRRLRAVSDDLLRQASLWRSPEKSEKKPPSPSASPHFPRSGMVRQLGQLHMCSRAAAMFLTLPAAPGGGGDGGGGGGGGNRKVFEKSHTRFPGGGSVSGLVSELVVGSAMCHAACLAQVDCRSWYIYMYSLKILYTLTLYRLSFLSIYAYILSKSTTN
jgi:hypothetical protein